MTFTYLSSRKYISAEREARADDADLTGGSTRPANTLLTADVVEVSELIDLAQRYQVQGVPKTVMNDRVEVLGAVPESRFVQEALKAIEPQKE